MFNSESQVSYFTTLWGNLKGNKSYSSIKKNKSGRVAFFWGFGRI
jgi:hypothetical protein